ncbi:jg22300 [Pararge aegeria aegeria]|uniref:Jg22300 protein n=1 Tax=Pararge aegeria aegeria TaxID=348720 RepID=A0A8S4SHG6_9NEOP|nr:jg22300 [Pararge aegeria aegeria]
MDISRLLLNLLYLAFINGFVIEDDNDKFQISEEISDEVTDTKNGESDNPANVFNGVYTECFFHLSYTCLQKKTLLYLKELNRLNEISVIGDYVKFVKLNNSENFNYAEDTSLTVGQSSDELAFMIDKAVDKFFDNHLIRFSALGKDVLVPNKVEEFVGRKKRKGGGGGGHGGGDGDGGKKKMMMMAMMCMKMKLMMMVPAMMGMMGMMSFKGMMFSMMSFMISKMMLLMKILEKKGGGAGGGGGADGGWAAGGGGGGAWMPTGQDYGGGGGGGYDANGQWQSRSIIEDEKEMHNLHEEIPIISYAKPIIRFNGKINTVKPLSPLRNVNDEITKLHHESKTKSRKKRGIIDVLQNAYLYWSNKVLGIGSIRLNKYPKYKIVNGIKYVYYPMRNVKAKSPKELQPNVVKENEVKTVIVDDFNKGEIIEGPIESRMVRKKFHKVKENVNETVDMVDDNPWQ